jgi:hypothetical protein
MKNPSITQILAAARLSAQRNAHQASLRPHLLSAPEVRAALAALKHTMPKQHAELGVYVSDYAHTVYLTLKLNNLNSLKDKVLAKVLLPFVGDEAWRSHTNDYTFGEEPNRDFSFERGVRVPIVRKTPAVRWLQRHTGMGDAVYMSLNVRISAYVKQDSDSCRIEVVERIEEVVIKEVKRIVCA